MTVAEVLYNKIQNLTPIEQSEVLDFVEFIHIKHTKSPKDNFSDLSLSMAMKGMEDEPAEYTLEDIKEKF